MFIVIFFLILFVILFAGVIMAFGSTIINWIFDEAVPEVSDLGQVGDWNATETAGMTITPLNNIVQSFTWVTGVLYVMALIGLLGIAFAFRTNPNRWLIAFYFMLVLLLVIGSIFVSNIYEDFYDDGGDVGTRLHEHTILSYMILYSPMIFTVISFIAGIVLFSGRQEENYV